jgi:signal transduction histidine kinase
MIGRPLAEWLHPEDVADLLATVAMVMQSGQVSLLVECRLRHSDGGWRDVETALNSLVDDPSVNGVVLNSRDITERKRAERELRETLEREHGMRERLQELDRVKTDFLSSVSHELRTPLTSILGYVEILGDGCGGPLAAEQTRVLGIVERNAQRLLILIEELLIMSKVESGSFTLSVGPVAIAELVEGAYQAVLPDLKVRDLEVTIDVAADAELVQGDAGQLDRVMINLLTNAIKFTPDGGRVSVVARRDGDRIALRVRDSGIGIPVEDQDRIFERFFRSSSTQHLAVRGTGLGLSITKAIIEEHGGSIAVSSQPGVGTEVTVTLPIDATFPEAIT